jgi:hypothetical protein
VKYKNPLILMAAMALAVAAPAGATTTTISVNGFYAANKLSDGTAMTSGTARFGFFIDTGALVTSDAAISSRWTSLLESSASTAAAINSFTSTFYSVLGNKSTAVGTTSIGLDGKFQILIDPDDETQEDTAFQALLDMNPSTVGAVNLINSSLATLKMNLLNTTPYVLVTSGNEIGVFKAGTALSTTGGSFETYSLAVRGTSVTALTGLGSTFANGIVTVPEPSAGALLIFGIFSVVALRRHTQKTI